MKNGVHTVWYYASKKIKKHDELLVDYKLKRSRFVKDAATCNCNTPSCRGTLYIDE